MANALGPAGPKSYGGRQPSGSIGAEEFAAHDGSKTWDDEGASQELVGRIADWMTPEIAALIADEVKRGVLEYLQGAFGEYTMVLDELVFLIDGSNNAVSFGTFYKSSDRLVQAIDEAEAAGDVHFLQGVGRHLEIGTARFQAVQSLSLAPPPARARPLREGNPKPAAVARGGRPGGGRAAPVAAPVAALPAPAPAARPVRPGAAHNARVSATPRVGPRPAS